MKRRGPGKNVAETVARAFSLHSTSAELVQQLAQKLQISQARVIAIALEKYGQEMNPKRNRERVKSSEFE